MHISTAHGGALDLESDTEGLLAQLAHICLLVGWVGGCPAYPPPACKPPRPTHKPRTKLFAIPFCRLLSVIPFEVVGNSLQGEF